MRKELDDRSECEKLRIRYEEEAKNKKGAGISVSMLECLVAFILALLGFGL